MCLLAMVCVSSIALSATGPPSSPAQFETQVVKVSPAEYIETAIEVQCEVVGNELVIRGPVIAAHEITLRLERSADEASLVGVSEFGLSESHELQCSAAINCLGLGAYSDPVKGGVPSAGTKLAV